jgi:ABC-type dipeptide/oligopeptide/nickel transport system permease component
VLSFLLQRAARLLLILVSVELLVFLLVHSVPGNPWDTPNNQLGARRGLTNFSADTATMARLSKYYGLDLPLWRQFTRYVIGDYHASGKFICGIVCGNLGLSIRQGGRSVQDILFSPPEGKGPWNSRVGYTVRLVSYSFVIVALLGIPLGVASAFWAKSWFDKTLSIILTAVVSIPVFVLGLLGIMIFASGLKWINVIPDWTQPKYWIIPTSLLVMIPLANMVRLTRAAMLNAMSGDYIRTARAKGLTRSRTIWRHVLPNALISILTFLLPTFVELFATSFIIEAIFGFPGFGREYWDAIGDLDYARIMGITFLYACGITFTNLFLETTCRLIDPRMRTQ